MAGLMVDVNFRSVALSAATAKTVVGIKAPTNQALKIHEICVSFDGADATKAPAVVDINRCTFATNAPGTNSSSFTMASGKRDPGRQETVQSTGATAWSSEPTVLTALQSVDVPEFNGLYHLIVPFTVPIIVPGGQGIAITITSPAAVNCSGHITFEE